MVNEYPMCYYQVIVKLMSYKHWNVKSNFGPFGGCSHPLISFLVESVLTVKNFNVIDDFMLYKLIFNVLRAYIIYSVYIVYAHLQ